MTTIDETATDHHQQVMLQTHSFKIARIYTWYFFIMAHHTIAQSIQAGDNCQHQYDSEDDFSAFNRGLPGSDGSQLVIF
jgi:hypothetical protein